MSTGYQPTVNERQAEDHKDAALHFIEAAIEKLGEAEEWLRKEEKLHTAISPSNQGNMVRYAEASILLDEAWEHIAGRPRVQVISSEAKLVRRLYRGEYIDI